MVEVCLPLNSQIKRQKTEYEQQERRKALKESITLIILMKQQKGRKALKESFTSIILKEKNCYTKFIESIIVMILQLMVVGLLRIKCMIII